ncbi:MAG: hypothetical protein KatS3mg105_5220 [Gemmatales bacterium]|nr:MAG: hypothetical protein KatS3mg105_5220 [Gemmatales bacterium]
MPRVTIPDVNELEANGLLFALLPGFLTYVVVHALTNRERPLETVEAVLHALGYTLLVHALWWMLTRWSWLPTPDLVGLSLSALVVGLLIAKLSNSGKTFEWLQKFGISSQPPWPSIGIQHFAQLGWRTASMPLFTYRMVEESWGQSAATRLDKQGGHVALRDARWLADDKQEEEELDLHACPLLLVPGEEIRFCGVLTRKK